MAERKKESAKAPVNPDFAQFRDIGEGGAQTDVSSKDGSGCEESSKGFFDSPADVPDDFDERIASGLTEDDVSDVPDPFVDGDNDYSGDGDAKNKTVTCDSQASDEYVSPDEEPVEIFIPVHDDDFSDLVLSINMKKFKIPKNKTVTVPRYVRDYYYTLCKQKADFSQKRNALIATDE